MNPFETVVLMSVYEKERVEHFRDAMISIISQTDRNFHVLLMLDGPVSAELISCLNDLNDGRIHVLQNALNQGLAGSLNALIEAAMRGPYEFLARMDSDDVADPERLQKQVEFLRRRPDVDLVGTFCEEVDEVGKHLFLKTLPTHDVQLKRNMLRRCPFVHSTVMFRRRVFASGTRYRSDTHLTEDMFLWVELAKAGFTFANIPEPLLKYRMGREFYRKRRGLRKAISEYKARRFVAEELGVEAELVTLSFDGTRYEVKQRRVVIGRSRECDVQLSDTNVSRRHAELRQEGASYWIVDLGSTNGLEVNGKRVKRAKLNDGDTITVGSTEVRFSQEQP